MLTVSVMVAEPSVGAAYTCGTGGANATTGLVLFITATATFLYGRKIHAGKVPSLSHEDLLAKEAAAFDLPAEELHHRGDPSGEPVTPRETRP